MEVPETCRPFRTVSQYLEAWGNWYSGIDRQGHFWTSRAPRSAAKKGLARSLAFAGLLVFDMMCMAAAKQLIEPPIKHSHKEDIDIPFGQIADFANAMPFATFRGKHDAVAAYLASSGAQVLLAKEARYLNTHPHLVKHWHAPFAGMDEDTQVLIQRDAFKEAENISSLVFRRMSEVLEERHPDQTVTFKRAWRTTIGRLAAVKCWVSRDLGGTCICFASMHCVESSNIPLYLESVLAAVREILEECAGGGCAFILGLDANLSAPAVDDFKGWMRGCGLEVGEDDLEQVTVSKQRTMFQTQVAKAGEADIAHKDYIVSWGSDRLLRGETAYTPDLWSAFGVHRETGVRTRLPTYDWPFDHCGVATIFTPLRRSALSRAWRLWHAVPALVVLLLALSPLASPCRADPGGGAVAPEVCGCRSGFLRAPMLFTWRSADALEPWPGEIIHRFCSNRESSRLSCFHLRWTFHLNKGA